MMEEKKLAGSTAKEWEPAVPKSAYSKMIQTITVAALPFVWIGYGVSLYNGNSNNLLSYSLLILMFSVMNQDVFFRGEKVSNRVLDFLAKAESVLFCIWVLFTIVHLVLK